MSTAHKIAIVSGAAGHPGQQRRLGSARTPSITDIDSDVADRHSDRRSKSDGPFPRHALCHPCDAPPRRSANVKVSSVWVWSVLPAWRPTKHPQAH